MMVIYSLIVLLKRGHLLYKAIFHCTVLLYKIRRMVRNIS